MQPEYVTDQENFWSGTFGNDYIARNNSDKLLFSKIALWSRMLRSANNVNSVFELGCNIGLNLRALRHLNPEISTCGIDINYKATQEAMKDTQSTIIHGSIIDPIENGDIFDLTFTAGVLIHINPKFLDQVYSNLYNKSSRYIIVAEYFNPTPVSVNYRGHDDRLFKRDFAGELIDKFGMSLVDYGFAYKRDNWAPQDDITWFLLEK